jgi:hypothetical protein
VTEIEKPGKASGPTGFLRLLFLRIYRRQPRNGS